MAGLLVGQMLGKSAACLLHQNGHLHASMIAEPSEQSQCKLCLPLGIIAQPGQLHAGFHSVIAPQTCSGGEAQEATEHAAHQSGGLGSSKCRLCLLTCRRRTSLSCRGRGWWCSSRRWLHAGHHVREVAHDAAAAANWRRPGRTVCRRGEECARIWVVGPWRPAQGWGLARLQHEGMTCIQHAGLLASGLWRLAARCFGSCVRHHSGVHTREFCSHLLVRL